MFEFSKGGRRKVGSVMLLVLGLLLVAGWVRSFIAHDSFSLPIGNNTTIGVMSAWGYLIGCVQNHPKVAATSGITKWTTRSDPFDDDTFKGARFGGFAIGSVSPYLKTGKVASRVLAIPYWYPVVSLLLLSYRLQQSNPPPLVWDQIRLWLLLFAAFFIFVLSQPVVQ